jgi:hypothetical protein
MRSLSVFFIYYLIDFFSPRRQLFFQQLYSSEDNCVNLSKTPKNKYAKDENNFFSGQDTAVIYRRPPYCVLLLFLRGKRKTKIPHTHKQMDGQNSSGFFSRVAFKFCFIYILFVVDSFCVRIFNATLCARVTRKSTTLSIFKCDRQITHTGSHILYYIVYYFSNILECLQRTTRAVVGKQQ